MKCDFPDKLFVMLICVTSKHLMKKISLYSFKEFLQHNLLLWGRTGSKKSKLFSFSTPFSSTKTLTLTSCHGLPAQLARSVCISLHDVILKKRRIIKKNNQERTLLLRKCQSIEWTVTNVFISSMINTNPYLQFMQTTAHLANALFFPRGASTLDPI